MNLCLELIIHIIPPVVTSSNALVVIVKEKLSIHCYKHCYKALFETTS